MLSSALFHRYLMKLTLSASGKNSQFDNATRLIRRVLACCVRIEVFIGDDRLTRQ